MPSAFISVFKDRRCYIRALEGALFTLAYYTLYLLYRFARPIDVTAIFMNERNIRVLEVAHSLMVKSAALSIIFKLSYYLGLPIILVGGSILLLAARKYKDFDLVIYAYIISYAVVYPMFFAFAVYEPYWVGCGYREDLVLWSGQRISSTNFFTQPTFTFPSAHTFLSIIMALAFIRSGLKSKYFIAILAFLITASTIMLGQHWLEDTIAGIVVAVLAYNYSIKKSSEYSELVESFLGKFIDKLANALKK
ncbi:MAG: hypothetical protein DRN20_04395 [Thermoplasmata archaeon]|nr:MAG: hypothetical protein DRN20_04395 [Thermoplasmata archaeon]